jgi:tetratricopeptide (TPR) repeat protein
MTDATAGGPGWRVNPDTLLPEITDVARFRAALADDPCRDVLTALWSGDPRTALELVTSMLASDPTHPRLLALQADCLRDCGDVAAARAQYEGLVAAHVGTEREAAMVQHLGKTLFVARDYAAAADCFARALELRDRIGDAELIASSRLALDRRRKLGQPPDSVGRQ